MSFTEEIAKLTDWKNEPTVSDLKTDFINCKPAHDNQMGIIDKYIRYLKAEPLKVKGRSSVQPKLIRKQAEWRYAALSEPFLSTDELFSVRPVTFEDSYGATQNELVLNYQFNTYVNKIKLIDDYVRSCVDVGTAIFRVDWLVKGNRSRHSIRLSVPTFRYWCGRVLPKVLPHWLKKRSLRN